MLSGRFKFRHSRSAPQTRFVPPLVKLRLDQPLPCQKISERFLSFSIDISVLAGGFWWEGSTGVRRGLGTERVESLQLQSKKLDRLVRALGPAYLRVGGSEADKIHYFDAPVSEPDSLVLTQACWDALHAFIERNALGFIFTFKYGLFKRHQHGDWKENEVEKLLHYSRQQAYRFDVCELGNELNAYWAFHGIASQPGPRKLALDYKTFAASVREYYPEAKISGPGSAFWPRLGETIKPFTNITEVFLQALDFPLDIVNWHYYPFQSERSPIRTRTASLKSMLSSKALDEYATHSKALRRWRDTHQPAAQIWTGETGSAQCGGQPRLSDRFASCFWWADQLGQGALLGQQIMVRQSLVGGDYGLIDRQKLKPRPDYWLSWLWNKLMGPEVYRINYTHRSLRVYCHNRPGGGLTLLLINLSAFRVKPLLEGFEAPSESYSITAKSLLAKKVKINGVKASAKKERMKLSRYPSLPHSTYVPANSICFWCYSFEKPLTEGEAKNKRENTAN